MPNLMGHGRVFVKYDFTTWPREPCVFRIHAHYMLGMYGAPDTHDEVAKDLAEQLRRVALARAYMPVSNCSITMHELVPGDGGECCISGAVVVASIN